MTWCAVFFWLPVSRSALHATLRVILRHAHVLYSKVFGPFKSSYIAISKFYVLIPDAQASILSASSHTFPLAIRCTCPTAFLSAVVYAIPCILLFRSNRSINLLTHVIVHYLLFRCALGSLLHLLK